MSDRSTQAAAQPRHTVQTVRDGKVVANNRWAARGGPATATLELAPARTSALPSTDEFLGHRDPANLLGEDTIRYSTTELVDIAQVVSTMPTTISVLDAEFRIGRALACREIAEHYDDIAQVDLIGVRNWSTGADYLLVDRVVDRNGDVADLTDAQHAKLSHLVNASFTPRLLTDMAEQTVSPTLELDDEVVYEPAPNLDDFDVATLG